MCECNCKGKKDDETHTQFMARQFMPELEKTLPIDFSTAQVGDTVRCLLNGDVKVREIIEGGNYPISVSLADKHEEQYISDGRLEAKHKNPSLIGWVDADGNLCRTRPEPKIDWSKVAVDTPVKITERESGESHISHYAGGESPLGLNGGHCFYGRGRTSLTQLGRVDWWTDDYATFKLINTKEK